MIEWLKALPAKLKEMWTKWKPVQKAILIAIVVAVIVAVALMFRLSAAPTGVPLFNTAIRDESARDAITLRLDQEGVNYSVNESGLIIVDDKKVADKMKSLLLLEGLVPSGVDAFNLFDQTSWTDTDFSNNVKLQRSITKQVRQHILAIEDIADANVILTFPEKALFASDQKPVTASVTVTFKPNSEMASNRKQLKGLQDLILRSVVGLYAENLVLVDNYGNTLNDFEGMAESDRLDNIRKEHKQISSEEDAMRKKVLEFLQKNFNGAERVRDLNIKIEKDMSKVTRDQTIYTPVVITEQDPDKPYDTTEKRDYLPISSQTVTKEWTGTGYNPEGPAGVEGQNPPVYSDMSNVIGKSTETGVTQNNVVNTEVRHTDQNSTLVRITASANIDGKWETQLDKNRKPIIISDENLERWREYCTQNNISPENSRLSIGHFFRVYHPVSQTVIEQVTSLVQDAIGYNKRRGDSVTITSFAIPRDIQWESEEDDYFRSRQTRTTVLLVLAGTAVVLLTFIIFRFISREMERRRRLREEEILRRQQAEREKALWDAKQEGMEVTMSVEERKRAELQENAIAMAKEHPEDVAMLIRTWLMEE
ncbi:flagellar basal-body MS-ring/collar protein FliF [Treponema pectinovorum]|uniref:flagellar basal-body MS-ring/collar protein FliF n=1 Tax=Treponema pectinovorum TaxID=164 RepID=UPI0011C8969A|nr:flagellar basal-body MS-ring/collar protein FliF [Treponema pectinovorum]